MIFLTVWLTVGIRKGFFRLFPVVIRKRKFFAVRYGKKLRGNVLFHTTCTLVLTIRGYTALPWAAVRLERRPLIRGVNPICGRTPGRSMFVAVRHLRATS